MRAAAEKLPCSAVCTNDTRCCSWAMPDLKPAVEGHCVHRRLAGASRFRDTEALVQRTSIGRKPMRALAAMFLSSLAWLAAPGPAWAQSALVYPPGFAVRDIATNGATIHVRSGGAGPAVGLLHGYGETGDMWVPLAVDLARDHTVIVPDLRGLGLSSKPSGGFENKSHAGDASCRLAGLGVQRADGLPAA